jgi:protein tyrosine/serine phosphatase
VIVKRLPIRQPLLAVLLALLAAPAAAAARSDALAAIRIDNFGRINDNYYRGAQPADRDYSDLAALGVKTVIDLTEDGDPTEAELVRAAGMKFHRIPMSTRETPSAAKVLEFLALVSDPANQPVYVHCQGGRHRTGVMTAVYRMTGDGWTADQAFAEMKKYKFGADFLHPEFKRFVYSYHPDGARVAAATVTAASPGASNTKAVK